MALRRGRGRARWLRVAKGQHGRGEGSSETRRLGARACKTCALGAPRARARHARQNARVVSNARARLAINRSGLEWSRGLVDMLVWRSKQVQNAKLGFMPILFMHSRCSTEY